MSNPLIRLVPPSDTLASRLQPASDRMQWARQKVEQWQAEGRRPAVRWVPSIAVVDGRTLEPLKAPAWARMELLWLLRREESFSAPSGPGVEFINWPRGVA